jgi:hypothetical protein
MLEQLLQPADYLNIKHEKKFWVDWIAPLTLTTLIFSIIYILRPHVNTFGKDGLVQVMTQFIQTLPGFYIAALAIVVTIAHPNMDELIPTPTPTLKESLRGIKNDIPLTRRRFLSMLFAFLAGESLIAVFMGLLGPTLSTPIVDTFKNIPFKIIGNIYLFLFLFLTFQMSVCTLWGLHYLGSKLHKPTL